MSTPAGSGGRVERETGTNSAQSVGLVVLRQSLPTSPTAVLERRVVTMIYLATLVLQVAGMAAAHKSGGAMADDSVVDGDGPEKVKLLLKEAIGKSHAMQQDVAIQALAMMLFYKSWGENQTSGDAADLVLSSFKAAKQFVEFNDARLKEMK